MKWEPKVDAGAFSDVQLPEDLDITPILLADLHDLTMCFGTESRQENVKRYVHRRDEDAINITVSTNNSNYGLIVGIGHVIPKPITLEGKTDESGIPCVVIIDHRLTSDILQELIVAADEQAAAKGGIKDGKRVNLNIVSEPPKMEVDVVFQQRGACMPVVPQDNDTFESMLERAKATILLFDRPAELGILNHPLSGMHVIRKADIDFLRKKDEVAHEVLKEQDIDPRRLGELEPEKVMELKQIIDDRLEAALEE